MQLTQPIGIGSCPEPDRLPRRGFSVVEVLVALVLIAVGLLGIAGSSALALRATTASARQQSALQLATTRLARLTATGCASATDGTTSGTALVREDWTIGPLAGGMRLISARVKWRATSGPRVLSLGSAMPC